MAALATQFKGKAKCIPENPERMLLPFQERWRADRSRLKICEKSRQIGFTWSDALDSMETTYSGLWDTWVSSRDELQAKLYLGDSEFWARHYQKFASAMELEDIVHEDGNKSSAYVQRFNSGKAIYSLSSNPDAQAGKRGTRKLDEFALHKDPKRLYDIAYPGITWGGQLCIFSTHRGAANFFNRLIREIVEEGNPKKFSHHKVTLEDALAEGLLFKLQQRLPAGDERMEMDEGEYFDYIKGGATDESAFLQEYMCIPEDEASAFITQDMLDGCAYKQAENLVAHTEDVYDEFNDRRGRVRYLLPHGVEPHQLPGYLVGLETYVGIDYGRHKDLSVVTVLQKVGAAYFTIAMIEMEKCPFYKQEAIYDPIVARARRTCLDQSGMGEKPVEDAQRKHGKYKAEGVKFTPEVKENLAYPVRAAFEDHSVKIPYDKQVFADFRMIRKETTAAGNIRFAAESNEGTDSHADRFWSFGLALHAAKQNAAPFAATSVNPATHPGGLNRALSRSAARADRSVHC